MQAVVLAGGYVTRLRPTSLYMSKHLVPLTLTNVRTCYDCLIKILPLWRLYTFVLKPYRLFLHIFTKV
jgi:hypothetical protein